MRLLIAGSTALLLLAACQQRANRAPGGPETGATGAADTAVTQPQPTTTDTASMTPDTSAKSDTTQKGGAAGKDTAKKP